MQRIFRSFSFLPGAKTELTMFSFKELVKRARRLREAGDVGEPGAIQPGADDFTIVWLLF
jgi:hypothetical protein